MMKTYKFSTHGTFYVSGTNKEKVWALGEKFDNLLREVEVDEEIWVDTKNSAYHRHEIEQKSVEEKDKNSKK